MTDLSAGERGILASVAPVLFPHWRVHAVLTPVSQMPQNQWAALQVVSPAGLPARQRLKTKQSMRKSSFSWVLKWVNDRLTGAQLNYERPRVSGSLPTHSAVGRASILEKLQFQLSSHFLKN